MKRIVKKTRATLRRHYVGLLSEEYDHERIGNWAISENGYEIRTVRELLGHKDVTTTMIYTHVLNRPGLGVRSPLDAPESP